MRRPSTRSAPRRSTTSSAFPSASARRAEVVTLAQNYRSTQPMLDAANALMAEAPRQHRKHLLSVRGAGRRGRARSRSTSCRRRPNTSAREVLERREAGVPLKRQAVLFRTGRHSDVLEVELDQAQDPVREVRRPEVPRGRARQGPARRCCAGPTTRATRSPRFACCSCCRAWGRRMRARRSTTSRRERLLVRGARELRAAARRADVRGSACVELLHGARRAAARRGAGQVRLVREWYQPHLERLYEHVPHAHRRSRAARAARRRSTPRASASSPSSRSIRRRPPATSPGQPLARRGLPGAVDHPFRQGHGVGHRVRAERGRRQLPVRVRDRQGRS